ncbi:hypothetical protein EV646_11629 [Kribbella antiqua]|uniref:Uncharacterized protein n=1 Tax=Kribbella antiqua TaxID=2512217 RepID=A0A4R2IBV7_9ACTN|nr:hypothetical protein [Kribbella antiqua]TCO40938.1 hypothetical protein EV646_11629 [Kribbella antiqua]
MDWDERELVTDYLPSGFLFRAFGGVSMCRFCGCANRALELTDGTWYWPDGLAHYVGEHAVRLPAEFVAHVVAEVDKLEEVERDVAFVRRWALNRR